MDPVKFELLEKCGELQRKEMLKLSAAQYINDMECGQYFALLLYQNELCSARALWLRIPKEMKERFPDLNQLWSVCEELCRHNFPAVFSLLKSYDWHQELKELIGHVIGEVQVRLLHIIHYGFTAIPMSRFCLMMNCSEEEASNYIKQKEWTLVGADIYTRDPPSDKYIKKTTGEPSSGATTASN